MRLVMLGTGPFAVPTFRRLLASRHEVVALVTRPSRPVHGKTAAEANPMRAEANLRGLPVFDPEDINAPASRAMLAEFAADLFVVCDYGQILSPDTLNTARLGGINLHGSLLPKYRGAAPINWAVYRGETETGVTVIHMTPQLDAGPAVGVARLAIPPDATAADLEPMLAELGAPLVESCVDALSTGTARSIEQDSHLATKARRLRKSDGQVDWRRSAREIQNQVRALQPWPNTFTHWFRPGAEPLRVILDRVAVVSTNVVEAAESIVEPGTVVVADGDQLHIGTGDGQLAILGIQPAGKRRLSTAEFLRGYPVKSGDRFGE